MRRQTVHKGTADAYADTPKVEGIERSKYRKMLNDWQTVDAWTKLCAEQKIETCDDISDIEAKIGLLDSK